MLLSSYAPGPGMRIFQRWPDSVEPDEGESKWDSYWSLRYDYGNTEPCNER